MLSHITLHQSEKTSQDNQNQDKTHLWKYKSHIPKSSRDNRSKHRDLVIRTSVAFLCLINWFVCRVADLRCGWCVGREDRRVVLSQLHSRQAWWGGDLDSSNCSHDTMILTCCFRNPDKKLKNVNDPGDVRSSLLQQYDSEVIFMNLLTTRVLDFWHEYTLHCCFTQIWIIHGLISFLV